VNFLLGLAQSHHFVPENSRIHRWCAGLPFCHGSCRFGPPERRKGTVCRGGSITSYGVRLAPVTSAAPDRVDPTLEWRLPIHAEHRGILWIQIQPDDVDRFALELRVIAGHIALQSMRLQPRLAPDALHRAFTDSELAASLRRDQCVDPSFGLCRVASNTLACSAGVITEGFWPGCRISSKSATRCVRNRPFQREIVGTGYRAAPVWCDTAVLRKHKN